ncbi:MAG: polysaccharide biosynthesis tyrosine autokinase [Pseudomonadota bacterium]
MTNHPIVSSPEGRGPGRELWVDGYLPPAYAEPLAAPSSMIDIAWLRGALFRQRWLIIATLIIVMLGGLIVTLLSTPIYQASASVRVSPFGSTWISVGQEATAPVKSNIEVRSFMKTQATVVESRKLAAQVAENLNPASRDALLGADVNDRRPPDRTDEQWANDKKRMAVSALRANVNATVPRDELLVQIVFTSADPVLASEAVNAYADAYVQSDTQRSLEGNAYAREYLLTQIETVRGQLAEAEKASNAFARGAGIVTPATAGIDGETGLTMTGANLASINQTVAAARAARITAEQKWRAVADIPAEQLPEVQGNAAIQGLIAEKAKLGAQLSSLRERYNDQFPEIVDIKRQIDLINEQIATTAANIKAGIRNSYVIAERQETALARELGNATSEALVEQDEKVEFTNLERNAQALRQQLNELLTRYNQISSATNVQSGVLTLLDSAVVPRTPIKPSLTRNMIVALVLGLAMAGGLALVREVFVDQFRRPEDVEDRLGVPVLGLTPYVRSDRMDGEEANQFSSLVEAYASIRSTLDFALPRDGTVLQTTSSQAAEGKSTSSLILAELFARLGRRTLLIDCDLRKPSIIPLLDIPAKEMGITEVLLGEATLEEAVIESVHDNLHILSVAQIPSNPVELLSSSRFRDFIDANREKYSVILIDSSPVLGLADAPEIAQNVDATIFVIEANRISVAQARTAVQRIKKVGGNVIGAILTKYRALEAGSDYTYDYQYYQYGRDK